MGTTLSRNRDTIMVAIAGSELGITLDDNVMIWPLRCSRMRGSTA